MSDELAYVGPSGELLIRDSVVLVVDELGTGSWMRDSFTALALEERASLLSNARGWLGGNPARNSVLSYTDNVILAEPIRRPNAPYEVGIVISSAAWYQLTLALQGVLTRGGIAVGQHHGSAELVAGPALMDAHEIEQSLAIYPRVMLSSRALETVRQDGGHYGSGLENSIYNDQLVSNSDGQVFVHYLSAVDEVDDGVSPDEVFDRHRQVIVDNLNDPHHRERARSKWVWAAGYHNWCITYQGRSTDLLAADVPPLQLSRFAGEPTYVDLSVPGVEGH